MSPIDPLGPLRAQIRSQALALRRKPLERGLATGKAGPASPEHALQEVIAQVATLSDDHPDSRRRAFRLFLRSVLTSELAFNETNSPSLEQLVDRVHAAMEQDGRIREALESAGEALLRMAQKR